MKTIEDIEKEYSEFTIRINTINSFKEFMAWMQVAFDEIDQNIKVLKQDYGDNRRAKIAGTIRNLFPFIYEYEDVSFYDKDTELVEEAYLLNKIYKNYMKQIVFYANEDNYKEMARFADFIFMYYDKDGDYIYSERDDLEYVKKGYGCVNNRDEDNSEVVHEFFMNKINEFKGVKGIEKVKKM